VEYSDHVGDGGPSGTCTPSRSIALGAIDSAGERSVAGTPMIDVVGDATVVVTAGMACMVRGDDAVARGEVMSRRDAALGGSMGASTGKRSRRTAAFGEKGEVLIRGAC
jgi:hypothetical protein